MSRAAAITRLNRQDKPGPRAQEEKELLEAIEPIVKDSNERYGSFKIHQELRGQGFGISRKRVARIIRIKPCIPSAASALEDQSPLAFK